MTELTQQMVIGLRLDVDYFGLGGDSEHLLTELKIANFYRIADGFVLANFLEGGYIASIKEVKINDRFNLTGDQLRGLNLGIGPRDSSTSDALGGEIYYVNRNELTFPLGLPDDLGLGGGIIFADVGSIYNQSSSESNIHDENSLRASAGIGLSWLSPFWSSKILFVKGYSKRKL